jgi:hypothetical protein
MCDHVKSWETYRADDFLKGGAEFHSIDGSRSVVEFGRDYSQKIAVNDDQLTETVRHALIYHGNVRICKER